MRGGGTPGCAMPGGGPVIVALGGGTPIGGGNRDKSKQEILKHTIS